MNIIGPTANNGDKPTDPYAGGPTTRHRSIARASVRPLWRATAFLRAVTFLFAVATMVTYVGGYARPTLGLIVVGVMGGWTVVTVVTFLRQPRWIRWVVPADVVISCGLMSTSLLVLSHRQYLESVPLITTVWVASVPVAAGVLAGRFAGASVGVFVAVVNGIARQAINTDVTRDGVLLIGAGLLIGAASTFSRTSAERLARALQTEAATAERERLARSIHDSALQVLARIRKEGDALGGQAAELAELAGEQEIALRTLIATTPARPGLSTDGTQADLAGRLQELAGPRVTISLPGAEVLLPVHAVDELHAVISEALANVARHAGEQAQAWVLLEDLDTDVVLSVRDDGIGIPVGRIDDAAAEGRLGVAQSIRARVAELGGTANLESEPGEGTEWEIHLPRLPETPRRS